MSSDPRVDAVRDAILGFPWSNYGLDEVGGIPDRFAVYANALANKIVRVLDHVPAAEPVGRVEPVDPRSWLAVMAVPMPDNDGEAATVGEYLMKLLALVWQETECFDGKRPFGNSSWPVEVHAALAAAGLVPDRRDEWGHLDLTRDEERNADALVAAAIDGLRAFLSQPVSEG